MQIWPLAKALSAVFSFLPCLSHMRKAIGISIKIIAAYIYQSSSYFSEFSSLISLRYWVWVTKLWEAYIIWYMLSNYDKHLISLYPNAEFMKTTIRGRSLF